MIKTEDNCVGCPPEMGCLGSFCPNRNVLVYICDCCKCEADELYIYDGEEQLCEDCLLDKFQKVGADVG